MISWPFFTLQKMCMHMVLPANTSGALQVVLMMRTLFILLSHAPVSMGARMKTLFPRLWATTTSVSQA